ncbi:hypothetical protein I7I53_10631 [Histoplasma capsulatum var. duboisii H88]|uniref:Uncharacterized protein n=1 Tax=Ajellomyces capsulatus (strain H88) TaxID=544711 RepID=A0A8A1L8W3_AJEC8|nr:hypothetical protein I7I53_10631 [Histoplasma capsulatum var. duboisii H88]
MWPVVDRSDFQRSLEGPEWSRGPHLHYLLIHLFLFPRTPGSQPGKLTQITNYRATCAYI